MREACHSRRCRSLLIHASISRINARSQIMLVFAQPATSTDPAVVSAVNAAGYLRSRQLTTILQPFDVCIRLLSSGGRVMPYLHLQIREVRLLNAVSMH